MDSSLQFDYVNERLFRSRLCPVPAIDSTLADRTGGEVNLQICNDTNLKQNTSRACYSYPITPEISCDTSKLDGTILRGSIESYNEHWRHVIAKNYKPYTPTEMPTWDSMLYTINQAYDTLSGFSLGREYDDEERNTVMHPITVELLRVYLILNNRYIVYSPEDGNKFEDKYPPYMALLYLQRDFDLKVSQCSNVHVDFENQATQCSFLVFVVAVLEQMMTLYPSRYTWLRANWTNIHKKYINDKIGHNTNQWIATSRFSEVYILHLADAVNRATREIRGNSESCVYESHHKSFAGIWKHIQVKCIKNASTRGPANTVLFNSIPTIISHLSVGPKPDMTFHVKGVDGSSSSNWQLSSHIKSPVHEALDVMKRQNSLMCRMSMVSAAKDLSLMRRLINLEWGIYLSKRNETEPPKVSKKRKVEDKEEEEEEEEAEVYTDTKTLPTVRSSFITSHEMDQLVHPSRLRYSYCLGDEMVYVSIPIMAKQNGRSIGRLDEPEWSPLGLTREFWDWATKRGRVMYYDPVDKCVCDGPNLIKTTKRPTNNPSRGDERKRDWVWTPICKEYYVFAPPVRNSLFLRRVSMWIEWKGNPLECQHAMDALCCLIDTSEEDVYATLVAIYPEYDDMFTVLRESYSRMKQITMDRFFELSNSFPSVAEWTRSTAAQWDNCNPFQPPVASIRKLTQTTFIRDVVMARLKYSEPPEDHKWDAQHPLLDEQDLLLIVNETTRTLGSVIVNCYKGTSVYLEYLDAKSRKQTKCVTIKTLVSMILSIIDKYALSPIVDYWRFRFPVSHIIRMGKSGRSTWAMYMNTNRANPRLYQLHADLISKLSDPFLIREIEDIHRSLANRNIETTNTSTFTSTARSLEEIDSSTSWGSANQTVNDQDLRIIRASLCILAGVHQPTRNSSSSATHIVDTLKAITRLTDPEQQTMLDTGLNGAFNLIKGSLDHQQSLDPVMIIDISRNLSASYPLLENHTDAFLEIFREMLRRSDTRAIPLSAFAFDNQAHANKLVSGICNKIVKSESWYRQPMKANSLAVARANASKQGISR